MADDRLDGGEPRRFIERVRALDAIIAELTAENRQLRRELADYQLTREARALEAESIASLARGLAARLH